ncbi:MAG: type I DNA topoisomerase [Capnocytophaga sp.]|nr:type I DNA topoisomerase [Capnocytophaga sp.]
MAKNLVIVESPAKAKTIEKFLGKDYKVMSSYGHIADLPDRELGVDVQHGFKPQYQISSDKKQLVKTLKEEVKKSDTIWLASDEDREGEAIAWHLAEELKLPQDKTKRIVFNSITKSAIEKAIANPRGINYDLVNAQQARRILDRLVGYELSPVLWKKIKKGLSAGRVQSVAVRLIVEKEREIQDFRTEFSYKVTAEFINSSGKIIKARINKAFASKSEANDFLKQNIGAKFSVADLETKPAKKSPAPPFTTSTLQQEAARKLHFSVSKTMQLAQRLYEAGFITYMRTDSVNLSQEAINAAKNEIEATYGQKFSKPRQFTSNTKGAQEAHEAIRPTEMSVHSIREDYDQVRLYELIWKRTIASQMSDAELERTQVKISANTHKEFFISSGQVIKFEGFLKVYLEDKDEEDEEEEGMLPALHIGEELKNKKIVANERFTRPPLRYTEASLVKKLEELGIGRPSTYASTISTIQNRGYVERTNIEGKKRYCSQLVLENGKITISDIEENVGADKGKLMPTDIGMIVNDFLINHFDSIVDYNFTAKVEEEFDNIASGKEEWSDMVGRFYQNFHPTIAEVEKFADRETGEKLLGTDPATGKPVSVRLGRYGAMVQIGSSKDEEKPRFASLLPNMSMDTITFEEAMKLFELPRKLGVFQGQEIEANIGRFGPYVRFGNSFISIDKSLDVFTITAEQAQEVILQKQKADEPIGYYDGLGITKGTGRFGPYIKWNDMFINVSKKYDFDNLTHLDLKELVEAKIKKELERVVKEWPKENIRIEKARWGRYNLIRRNVKVELSKDTDIENLSLDDAVALLASKEKPKKETKPRIHKNKTTTKTKKEPAKKKVAKK